MRWCLAVTVGLLAVVPAARAQNGGASLGTPSFSDPTDLSSRPVGSDRPITQYQQPVQTGLVKASGPVKGTNLSTGSSRYNGDAPIDEYHRPPDIGGGSGSQGGVQLGTPRGGVGSAAVDSDEEKYNWGVSGGSNRDRPNDYGAPRGYDKKSNAGRDKPTKWQGDDFDRLPSESGSRDRPASGSDSPITDFGKDCYDRVRRNILEGDPDFDDIMPFTSNPLYAEDPKTSTEIRPLYFYQTIPGNNYLYKGGNVQFIGLQARVAFGERWSIVMNQLGWYGINPNSASRLSSESGFGELHLGVKWTFFRDRESNTIAAAGLNFQLPTGAGGVYQDTGNLSLSPYGSIGHRFGKSSYGNWGINNCLGFSFATSEARANFLFNSLHFDYDIANYHRFFPFAELNWFSYFRNGNARPLGFEGQDFANIGAIQSGKNYLNIATGSRFRVGEHTQFGIGFQFPLTNPRDLNNFRLNLDFIWRY